MPPARSRRRRDINLPARHHYTDLCDSASRALHQRTVATTAIGCGSTTSFLWLVAVVAVVVVVVVVVARRTRAYHCPGRIGVRHEFNCRIPSRASFADFGALDCGGAKLGRDCSGMRIEHADMVPELPQISR
ncbi:hypothetical protein IG631_24223 [Alternaria alternata]|nr:hypothetical protein IG631_24223 [Alternaria alternata]